MRRMACIQQHQLQGMTARGKLQRHPGLAAAEMQAVSSGGSP